MIDRKRLYEWCSVPAEELKKREDLKVKLRVVKDSAEMGEVMARDLVESHRRLAADFRSGGRLLLQTEACVLLHKAIAKRHNSCHGQ